MTKTRRGRPPLGATAATASFRLRVEPDTLKKWRETARVLGMSLAEFVRRRCG